MAWEASLDQVRWRRLAAGSLGRRLPAGSVAAAAHGGLQDSAPRAALLALHARLEGVELDTWEHPELVQLWLRGGAAYVVPRADVGVFTLGASPRDPEARRRLEALAEAVLRQLPDGRADHRAVAAPLGELGHPGVLRAVAVTGRVHIRWDARTTVLLAAPRPEVDEEEARIELARRFVHWLGPTTRQQLQRWVGATADDAKATWAALSPALEAVTVAGRTRHLLSADAASLAAAVAPRGVRLLPLGDPALWPAADLPAPPPPLPLAAGLTSRLRNSLTGRVLLDGALVGAWGRSRGACTLDPWPGLPVDRREEVAAEAEAIVRMLGYPFRLRWLAR